MAIDVHAHVIVRELLCDAAPDELWRPAVSGGKVEFGGRPIGSIVDACVDVDEGLARCRLQNEGLARLRGDRVAVLAQCRSRTRSRPPTSWRG